MATPRGKIGRLPETLRKQINGMLRDNKTAEEIIALLESKGLQGVTPSNISAWKKWGFEKWNRRMERLDDMACRREFARQLVTEAKDEGADSLTVASDAASALVVEQIAEALEEFDPTLLKGMLAEKPEKFMDLAHALATTRKGDQAAVLLQHRVDQARALAKKARAEAEKNGNTDLKQLADAMDACLSG